MIEVNKLQPAYGLKCMRSMSLQLLHKRQKKTAPKKIIYNRLIATVHNITKIYMVQACECVCVFDT